MIRMWRKVACVAALSACPLLSACAGPVPDYGAYRHAALNTAMAMVSSLASAQLVAELGLRGSSFPAFTDNSITEAENDADSVNSTFSSRQPPAAGCPVRRAASEDVAGAVGCHQRADRLARRRPDGRPGSGEPGAG